MPPDVAEEVIVQLKWERGASAVFRRVCKGWRDAHEQCALRLSVNACLSMSDCRFNYAKMMSRFIMRFQRINEIVMVRGPLVGHPAGSVECSGADKWLQALAGLTALTSLDLQECWEVTDDGLRALSSLTALTDLHLGFCRQVSDNGLRVILAGLTALSTLGLSGCEQVSDVGLRDLAGLTTLTDLDLGYCRRVSDDGVHELAKLTALTNLNLEGYHEISEDGLQALDGLTDLTLHYLHEYDSDNEWSPH